MATPSSEREPTRAYAGIDVAVAKNKRLPVSVCVWREGRVKPLPLRRRKAPLPPKLPGNLAILVPEVRRRLAIETAAYLHRVEHHFDVRICRIAIDAPRRPRLGTSLLRQCEAALGEAGISYIQTPDEETFARIPKDVAAYQLDPGSRTGLPHANRIWMLFGFELFAALTAEGWPCIEVYPQATVRGLGAGERHKKTPGAVLEQLTAASAHTGWPAMPSLDELRAIAFGSLDDCLDAYLSAWVASLPEDACEALGNPPDDVIWRPAASGAFASTSDTGASEASGCWRVQPEGELNAMSDRAVAIEALTPEERLELLERLWESLSRTPDRVPLTEQQRVELDRRLDALDDDLAQGRALGVPWDEVVRQIRNRV